ncbi:hypothetical protein KM043_004403 [Ampulex compressa]|nr:hypothetical protein KM043_004403 [Ampulex compressa]
MHGIYCHRANCSCALAPSFFCHSPAIADRAKVLVNYGLRAWKSRPPWWPPGIFRRRPRELGRFETARSREAERFLGEDKKEYGAPGQVCLDSLARWPDLVREVVHVTPESLRLLKGVQGAFVSVLGSPGRQALGNLRCTREGSLEFERKRILSRR